jgi:hypothetical protein
MAARPLGQRITGDPRSARVHRATTTAPLSPPSAPNRAPAPVVGLGRALDRGEGVRGAIRGVGYRLADPCARLATWLHAPGNGGDRQGASLTQGGRRAAPAASITRMAWGGGGLATKTKKLTQYSKHFGSSLGSPVLLTCDMVRSEYGVSANDGLGYFGSEPSKLIYLVGDLRHAAFINPHWRISRPLVETTRPRDGLWELGRG